VGDDEPLMSSRFHTSPPLPASSAMRPSPDSTYTRSPATAGAPLTAAGAS
jgi:hypothetical protein